MSNYENRRYDRQNNQPNSNGEDIRNEFRNNENRHPGDDNNRNSQSRENWRDNRQQWRNNPDERQEWDSNRGESYGNQYADPRYTDERFSDCHYAEQAYRGLEYSDRGRRNSEYRNPDYGSRANFEHNRYNDLDTEAGYRASRGSQAREADRELWEERGPYSPSVDGRSLGRRDAAFYRDSHWGKGPKNYVRQDPKIHEDVCDALTDSHSIDASDVEVMVKDGIVILSGDVASRNEKRDAESAVDYISGVRNVENRIHVKTNRDGNSQRESKTTQSNQKSENKTQTAQARNGKIKA